MSMWVGWTASGRHEENLSVFYLSNSETSAENAKNSETRAKNAKKGYILQKPAQQCN